MEFLLQDANLTNTLSLSLSPLPEGAMSIVSDIISDQIKGMSFHVPDP